jgi:hypothetical protein
VALCLLSWRLLQVHMLSLQPCNNINFHEGLIPTDSLECLSRASRPTSLHLDKTVFESGSMILNKKQLQIIRIFAEAVRDKSAERLHEVVEKLQLHHECCTSFVKWHLFGKGDESQERLKKEGCLNLETDLEVSTYKALEKKLQVRFHSTAPVAQLLFPSACRTA